MAGVEGEIGSVSLEGPSHREGLAEALLSERLKPQKKLKLWVNTGQKVENRYLERLVLEF